MEKAKQFLYDHPVPGASLTNSPENKLPFERPPKFSSVDKVLRFLWMSMAEQDYQVQLIDFLRKGMPVADIATLISKVGVYNGMWNTDVSLLILEPLIYMILQVAYDNGIDYVYSRQIPTTLEGMVRNKMKKQKDLQKRSDEAKMKKQPVGLMMKGL